ncbi:RNA-directed DNA polymerase, eukaryota, reverse transcriptase zinc-binding domain protein [Tanacetum coccineum]
MEMNDWSDEMKRYYRDKKEFFDAVKEMEENEDVLDENDDVENIVLRNKVEGEVKKIIQEEGLQLCAILETHVKFKNIKKTCENVFGDWKIQAWMISQSRQSIFLMVETIDKKSKFFCTVIYASNFNVTLKVSEHLHGSANPSSEMTEFQDCINGIEVEDLHSEGFHYRWTKSLKNPKCRTLKKMDRVMLNEAFMEKYQHAHGIFLPYMISDHSPIIGHTMYKVVQKMKALKKKLKLLNWRNGNVFERGEELRKKVKESQNEVDMFPHDEKDSKAPKPDGYTSRFYKTTWSIVGKEVSQAMREFVNTGKLLGEVNATLISLVPKIPIPGKVTDFRPIACCNVMYKCISKIMTNRLKGVLGKLVNENQSAFISGRQITYNILLAQELFRGYNRKQHFSININGERVGYFKEGRGLRQGDPISLYLFTLVMEVLNLIIRKNIEENAEFKYYYGCKKLEITHLRFADDLLVFCHGDCASVRIMKKSLDEFSSFSGLLPNMQKITLFFGGLSNDEQQNILNIIPFSVGKLLVRYLGIPLITKQISINDCKPLVNKVKTKINDWKNKSLSYAGRVQLIESVLNSMQNYWASVFLLLKQVIYEIDKMLKATKKDTLWVKWIIVEKLKGKSIWEVQSDCNSSVDGVLQVQIPDLNDGNEDTAVWVASNGQEQKFKISNVWKERINNGTKVDWYSMKWQERNNRLFKNEKRESKTVLNIAKEAVGMKLMGLKVKESKTVKEVEERWNVKMQRRY